VTATVAVPTVWRWGRAVRTAFTDLVPTLLSLTPIGLVVGLAIGRSGTGTGSGWPAASASSPARRS